MGTRAGLCRLEDRVDDIDVRLSVLEGVEEKRADRESSLGYLQVIGQLEDEVERLEKQNEHLIGMVSFYKHKADSK